jgi:hypothetical protein
LALAGFSCPPPARGFRQRAKYLSYLFMVLGLWFPIYMYVVAGVELCIDNAKYHSATLY